MSWRSLACSVLTRERPTASTCTISGSSRHSRRTPCPTIPVAPKRITFIVDFPTHAATDSTRQEPAHPTREEREQARARPGDHEPAGLGRGGSEAAGRLVAGGGLFPENGGPGWGRRRRP